MMVLKYSRFQTFVNVFGSEMTLKRRTQNLIQFQTCYCVHKSPETMYMQAIGRFFLCITTSEFGRCFNVYSNVDQLKNSVCCRNSFHSRKFFHPEKVSYENHKQMIILTTIKGWNSWSSIDAWENFNFLKNLPAKQWRNPEKTVRRNPRRSSRHIF